MADWLLILGGLVTLIAGAELLVHGAVRIALALGISKLMVGLTIVAIGTSAPELVVGVVDVLKVDSSGHVGAIALGTVFGSNVANIGLILGLTALVRPIPTTESKLRFEAAWLVLASVLCMKPLIQTGQGRYSHSDGAVLCVLVLVFTLMLVQRERRKDPDDTPRNPDRNTTRTIFNVALVVFGLVGLTYGGQWLISGARGAALSLGMPDSLIGATIVAVGTSLPELATAVVAARRGHPELAVGNIVGSNIFNIGMVLGVCAMVRPLPVTPEHGLRMFTGLFLALVLGFVLMRRTKISRRTGGILLVCYLGYLTAEVARL
ncbi:MAG: calcium/sodium antiporter [Planctomycetota bacterium]